MSIIYKGRSISENTTWGRREAFSDGNYSLPRKSFYGCDKGEDGKPVINPVQAEVQRRKGKHYSGVGIFSSKIICGECGNYYGSKVWHSTDKYRRVICSV